jgi:Flp pilus assembly protein TadG
LAVNFDVTHKLMCFVTPGHIGRNKSADARSQRTDLTTHSEVSAHPRHLRRRGSTLVEFALVVPILLMLLIGIMEFGWLVKNHLLVANATREGARAASLGKTTTDVRTRVTNSVEPLAVSSPDGTILMNWSDNNGADHYSYTVGDNGSRNNVPAGKLIRIIVRTKHRPLTTLFSFLTQRNIEVYVTMRREAT